MPRQHPKDNASKEIAGIDNKHYSGVTRAQAQDRRPVVVLNDDGKKIGGDAYTDNGDYNEVKVNQFKSTKCGQRLCMQINEDKIKIGCQAFAIKEKSAERGCVNEGTNKIDAHLSLTIEDNCSNVRSEAKSEQHNAVARDIQCTQY